MAREPKPDDKVQTDEAALAAIAEAGFSGATALVHHGHVWQAEATDSTGAAVKVLVHARTGRVNVGDVADASEEPDEPAT